MSMPSQGAIRAGQQYIEISVDSQKVDKHFRTLEEKIHAFGDKISATGGDFLRLGMYFAQPATFAVKKFADFDDTMRAVKQISSSTAEQIYGLTEQAKLLGKTTAFTSQQVGEGMLSLARMGFTASEIKDSIQPMMLMVRATGSEVYRLGELSQYTQSVMRAFRLNQSSVADIADVMQYAQNNSATTIDEIGEAMKIVSPTAYAFGENTRDQAQALMVLANAGVRGTLAGTALRKMYSSLATDSGMKKLQELGINAIDSRTGEMRKVADIMLDISKAMQDSKKYKMYSKTEDIFDLRGALGALTILNNPESLQGFRKNIENISGYAKKTADSMEQGIGGVIRGILSRLENIVISFGEQVSGTFDDFKKDIFSALESITDFIQKNKELIKTLAILSFHAVSLGISFKQIGTVAKVTSSIVSVLRFAVPLLSNFFFNYIPLIIPVVSALGFQATMAVFAMKETSKETERMITANRELQGIVDNTLQKNVKKGNEKLVLLSQLEQLAEKSKHARLKFEEMEKQLGILDKLGIKKSILDSYDDLVKRIQNAQSSESGLRDEIIKTQKEQIKNAMTNILLQGRETTEQQTKSDTSIWGYLKNMLVPEFFKESMEETANKRYQPLFDELKRINELQKKINGVNENGTNVEQAQENKRNTGFFNENLVSEAQKKIENVYQNVGQWSLSELSQNAGNVWQEKLVNYSEKSTNYLKEISRKIGKTVNLQYGIGMVYEQ